MSITQPIYGGKRKQKRRRKCMLLPRHRQNLFLGTLHKISAPFLCNPPNFQNKRCTFAIFGSICMKAFLGGDSDGLFDVNSSRSKKSFVK